MQTCLIGSGYAVMFAATCLAEVDHDVRCVDSDAEKALLAAGIPIHEDYAGLDYWSVGRPAVESRPANACATDRIY